MSGVLLAALSCLGLAAVLDLLEERRKGGGQPGLAWQRAGCLGLWIALALRLEAASPGAGPALAVALAALVPLHLTHVQGWKGARGRRAAVVGSLAALALSVLAGGIS